MPNNKKNKRIKKKKEIISYTKEERSKQIEQLKMKLGMVGVSQITNNKEEINTTFKNFIEDGIEYEGSFKLHGAKYRLDMKLFNNNKKTCEIFLKYDESI